MEFDDEYANLCNNIHHALQVDTKKPFGPKKKCPWISINGEDIGDSEFVIDYLSDHFNVSLDTHLDPQRAATAEAVRILADEHLFW